MNVKNVETKNEINTNEESNKKNTEKAWTQQEN